MMRTRPLLLGLVITGVLAALAPAQRSELAIDDVPLTLVDDRGEAARIDLGDITVTLANRSGSGMSAVFRVAPEFRPGSPGGDIWDHLEVHWVNIITDDDCPASVGGIAAGSRRLPFPLIDMPRNGWDYVYRWRGRGRPERTEANADGRDMRDDARDVWPWYHTPEEEAMHPDSGNGTGGFGQFRHGVTYGIRDLPSLCDGGGITAFTTLLVAVVPEGAGDAGRAVDLGGGQTLTLQGGQLLVLAGFDWDWSSRAMRLDTTDFGRDDLNLALEHSRFPEWQGVEGVPVLVGRLEALVADSDPQEAPAQDESRPVRAAPGLRGLGKPE